MSSQLPTAEQLKHDWATNPRWAGIERGYSAEEVVRLRGTVAIEHSIARITAEKLWKYLGEKPFVNALGALTGNQAMQQVKAGLNAIYLSGWQVAADANVAGEMMIALMLEDILADLGHEVAGVAMRLPQAIELAKGVEADIAILDINPDGQKNVSAEA